VYGEIAVETRPNAVVIPVEALVPEGTGYKVFVVDKAGTAHEHEVKIGGRTTTKVEITEGLTGGETVVTQGAFGVEDSAKIATPLPAKP
jgi:membrane fusion protein (multidrug efflux system)